MSKKYNVIQTLILYLINNRKKDEVWAVKGREEEKIDPRLEEIDDEYSLVMQEENQVTNNPVNNINPINNDQIIEQINTNQENNINIEDLLRAMDLSAIQKVEDVKLKDMGVDEPIKLIKDTINEMKETIEKQNKIQTRIIRNTKEEIKKTINNLEERVIGDVENITNNWINWNWVIAGSAILIVGGIGYWLYIRTRSEINTLEIENARLREENIETREELVNEVRNLTNSIENVNREITENERIRYNRLLFLSGSMTGFGINTMWNFFRKWKRF